MKHCLKFQKQLTIRPNDYKCIMSHHYYKTELQPVQVIASPYFLQGFESFPAQKRKMQERKKRREVKRLSCSNRKKLFPQMLSLTF